MKHLISLRKKNQTRFHQQWRTKMKQGINTVYEPNNLEQLAKKGYSPVSFVKFYFSKKEFVKVFLNNGEPSSNPKYFYITDSEKVL